LVACTNQADGELMVVVSTDMALPADLDWLAWTVTRPSHPERAPDHGELALTQFDALPATLAIIAERGEESVVVSLDARLGGKDGALRVHREARVTVPAQGQEMLQMPLNWLCSDANQSTPCADGMTCQAGRCVSSQSTGPLPEYVPLPKSPCFDTLQCTLVGSAWSKPVPNATGTACTLDANLIPVGTGALSVALVVDTEAVGNAGVCAPSASASGSPGDPASGLCFIPINQDASPDGWQLIKDEQGQTGIRLPDAVCDNGTAIKSVALTRAGCAPKAQEHPLCAAPSVCVASASSCPSSFPATWSGYSCSSPASPATSDPALTYCPIADADPEIGPVIRGHVCCTAGQAASDNPLLIDDMSGGPLIKLPHPADESAGNWFTASQDTQSPLSPPQQFESLFTYRSVPPVTPEGGPEISSAACFRMREGFIGDYALEGFSFFSKGSQVIPVDVSQYTGMTFWATLTSPDPDNLAPLRVEFPNSDTDTQHRSTCIRAQLGNGNCNHFGLTLTGLSGDWQKYTVTWDELTQFPGFGQPFNSFDTNVYSVDFELIGSGPAVPAAPFDFCVSQIYFTQ
jgi:hypothetical protein